MSWKKDGGSVAWGKNEDKSSFPRIRWNNGMKKGRFAEPGCFYGKAEQLGECPENWTESNLFPNEVGYQSPAIALVPIIKRTQPFTVSADGVTTWYKHYERDKGMKLYTETVCLLRGYNSPVILTTKGWIAGRINGVKNSVYADHMEYVVKPANAQAEKPLPQWAFWIEFGGLYEKGNPVHVEVGTGQQKTALHDVVLYAVKGNQVLYGMKDAATEEQIDRLYIGTELFKTAAALRDELVTSGWAHERRGNLGDEPEQEKPQKNAPKVYTPDPGAAFDDESPY